MLLGIIIIMVTISIRLYSLPKIALISLILFCLASLSAFAQSPYVRIDSTPYDRQMARIRPILASAAAHKEQSLSFELVNRWIGNLRAIPYGFSMEWKTPQEVRTSAFADCKGKAVALYSAMHSQGAQNVRLVIGRRLPISGKTHAWVEWSTADGIYILDPTINWSACRADHLARGSYIPLYAYAGGQKFRASTSSVLYARNHLLSGQRVASRL